MTVEIFASNRAATNVSSGGTDAPAQGTQETWTVVSSSGFPSASPDAVPPGQFHVADQAAPSEIIAVTDVSGVTWTVTRGAESTTPVSHGAGFTVYQVLTSGTLGQFYQAAGGTVITQLQPSGDTTGATDTAAINAIFGSTGQYARLAPGTFYVDAPVVVTGGSTLEGAKGATTSVYDIAPPGTGLTVITPVSGFTASGSGSYGVVQMSGGSCRLRKFVVDGSNLTSGMGTIHGVVDNTSQNAVQVHNVGVYNLPAGDGIRQNGSAWHLFECVVCTVSGDCFHGSWTDSVLVNCHGQNGGVGGGGGSAFWVGGGEVHLIGCRGDLSQWGFSIDAPAASTYQDPIILAGCSTQRNNGSAIRVRNAYSANGAVPLVIAGFFSDGDGANGTISAAGQGSIVGGVGGGGYAALDVWGQAVVAVSGFANTVSSRDSSTPCPQYGIATHTDWGGGSHVPDVIMISGSFFAGDTAVVNDAAPAYLLRRDSSVAGYSGGIFKGVNNSEYPSLAVPNPVSWQPSDNGLLVASDNFMNCLAGTVAPVAGQLYLVKLQIRDPLLLSNLWWTVEAAGNNTGGSAGTFVGLYSSSGTLLTGSSDVASAFTSAGSAETALTTPQRLSEGTFVWAALLLNLGTTQPTLFRPTTSSGSVAVANLGLAAAAYRFCINGGTGVTSLPSSITPASNSLGAGAAVLWAGAS